ncbi:MAG: ATP-binding protein [Fibrobacteres bacterium]|jgi:predicted AAA+ superfamily ATPase|nr:ATP-binding protein [Fibrobacterota bacterium]
MRSISKNTTQLVFNATLPAAIYHEFPASRRRFSWYIIGVIHRHPHLEAIREALERSRVVVLIGPRQCGKTTLARELVPEDSVNYFDLEDPGSLARLDEPMTALAPLRGMVVIDEIQRRPELFPTLRVLADRRGHPARFLVLGSASGELMRQSSESLAGRMELVNMGGFSLCETGPEHERPLWLRGGFPLAYLAPTHKQSMAWRKQFIQTILERDLPQWGVRVGATALRRFWLMVAHYHGQIWNAADPARSLGVNESTVRRYLDLLTDAQMLRQLQPYHANVGKRQVKSPKVYVRDSGLFHQLMGLETEKALLEHPKAGASWEGFAIEQILSTQPHDEAWFWATHQGAEMDLVLSRHGKLFGVEIKRTDSPQVTPSIRNALLDLDLERVAIVHPGIKRYPLSDRVEAVPMSDLGTSKELFPAS